MSQICSIQTWLGQRVIQLGSVLPLVISTPRCSSRTRLLPNWIFWNCICQSVFFLHRCIFVKVYFSKVYFYEVYPTYASSKLCEFIAIHIAIVKVFPTDLRSTGSSVVFLLGSVSIALLSKLFSQFLNWQVLQLCLPVQTYNIMHLSIYYTM